MKALLRARERERHHQEGVRYIRGRRLGREAFKINQRDGNNGGSKEEKRTRAMEAELS